MKKLFVFVFVAFLCSNTIDAQDVKWGIRIGGSTTSLDGNEIKVATGGIDTFRLAIQDAKFGIHLGAFARIELGPMFIQPEILFNSSSVTYSKEDFTTLNSVPVLFKDTYNHLDIPIMIGVKMNALRLQGGIIGSILLSETTDLTEIATFEREADNISYGWQAGVGIDVARVSVDLKYEGNFNRFGDNITLVGNQYSFDARKNRFVVTMGFSF